MKTLLIKRKYFTHIKSGRKTIEVRVGYSNIRKLRPGDLLEFKTDDDSLVAKIVAVHNHESFDALLAAHPADAILPGATPEEILATLQEIYPPEKEALGVVELEIRTVRRSS